MKCYHFASIDSTNNWAKENCPLFCKDELTLIVADEQTHGRGRFGRRWHAPGGYDNLYVSFVCFLPDPFPDLLVQQLAKAIKEVLEQEGVMVQIKWPNDLMVRGKKLAGILIEVSEDAVIMGVGLNVNMPQEELDRVMQPATSLMVESGHSWNKERLLQQITEHLQAKLSGGCGRKKR